MRRSLTLLIFAMATPAAALISSCGGGAGKTASGGSTTTTPSSGSTSTGTTTSPPGPDCGAPSGSVAPYDSEASGTVSGAAVSASLCNLPAHLYVSPYTTPKDRVLLLLDSTGSSAITFQSPPGAADPILTGMIAAPSASPGVYQSTATGACGGLVFSYALPVPPGLDCSGTTPPTCPPGCASVCSGQGCVPCAPSPPEVAYEAKVPSDCLGNTQAGAGAWTLTLTSVVPFTGDGGSSGTYYVPHGSLTATLVGPDGGAGSAVLSVGF